MLVRGSSRHGLRNRITTEVVLVSVVVDRIVPIGPGMSIVSRNGSGSNRSAGRRLHGSPLLVLSGREGIHRGRRVRVASSSMRERGYCRLRQN